MMQGGIPSRAAILHQPLVARQVNSPLGVIRSRQDEVALSSSDVAAPGMRLVKAATADRDGRSDTQNEQ